MKRCRYCGGTPYFARFVRTKMHLGCVNVGNSGGHENWVMEEIAKKEINGEIVNDEQATIQILIKRWNKGN